MLDLSTAFLIGVAGVTFAVAGLCLVAYDVSARREQLRGRVDLVAVGRRVVARSGGRTQPPEGSNLLTISTLRGDELQFARWVQPLHIPPHLAPRLFLALRLVIGLALAVGCGLLGRHFNMTGPILVIVAAAGGAFGWWLPHNAAERSSRNRKRSITRGLPDAMELLVIAVEAGLSLEDAINRIVIELRPSQPAVSEELAVTAADLRMLPNRDDALRRLAERLDMPSVNSVVTTLSQTLKYGTPLAQALRVVASELRNDALLRLEEQANRMPVLLTIPMIVFILPSLFLIIGGPAFLRVLDALTQWHH